MSVTAATSMAAAAAQQMHSPARAQAGTVAQHFLGTDLFHVDHVRQQPTLGEGFLSRLILPRNVLRDMARGMILLLFNIQSS